MNTILQLYKDNLVFAKEPINLSKTDNEATMYIHGIISSEVGIGALQVIEALGMASEADVLNVHIKSPGGDVFESREIMAAIRAFNGKTIAYIGSLCASAATSIALACDEVEMSDGAFFMIHNAHGLAFGDKTALRKRADLMEKVEGSIVEDYTTKTGKDATEIIAMMDVETWMNADEALAHGFIDRVASSKATKNTWNLAAFVNVPKELIEPEPEATQEPAPAGFLMSVANANKLKLIQAL